MSDTTSERQGHDRADGAELVRNARWASSSRYSNPSVALGRLARGLGDFFGELLGEAVLALLALALFGGVVAITIFGWQHNPVATVGVYVIVIGFLAYGAYELVRPRKREGRALNRRRLAAVASASVIVVLVWLLTVLQYHG